MKRSAIKLAEAFVSVVESLDGKLLDAAAGWYLEWLREHGESHRLPEIIRAIDDVWKKRFGAAHIVIETAHPLSWDARAALEKQARGADVSEAVRPNLIGGARLRVDDLVLDGSIAGQLARLSQTLLQ